VSKRYVHRFEPSKNRCDISGGYIAFCTLTEFVHQKKFTRRKDDPERELHQNVKLVGESMHVFEVAETLCSAVCYWWKFLVVLQSYRSSTSTPTRWHHT